MTKEVDMHTALCLELKRQILQRDKSAAQLEFYKKSCAEVEYEIEIKDKAIDAIQRKIAELEVAMKAPAQSQ